MPISVSVLGCLIWLYTLETHVAFYTGIVYHFVDMVRRHTGLYLSCSDVQNLS